MFAPVSLTQQASAPTQHVHQYLPHVLLAADRYIFTLPKMSNPGAHQAYYVSSGHNSNAEGTVFPFYGISNIFKKTNLCSFQNCQNFFAEQIQAYSDNASSLDSNQPFPKPDFRIWCRDVFEALNTPSMMRTPEESFLMDVLQTVASGRSITEVQKFLLKTEQHSISSCQGIIERKFEFVLDQEYGGGENAKKIIHLLKRIGDDLDASILLARNSAGLELRFGNLENLMLSHIIGLGFWKSHAGHPAVQELKALLDSDVYFNLRSVKQIDVKEFEQKSFMKLADRRFGFVPETQSYEEVNLYLLQKNALSDIEFSRLSSYFFH